ncbi:MAG: helix-hairpin-helix domain-containing protein [Dokdonella sp.]
MHPDKVDRAKLERLVDLPNVGPAMEGDLQSIGIDRPEQLQGRCPLELYQPLCVTSGMRQDPCVLDVLMSITCFVDGAPARSWWSYTDERKSRYGAL